MHWRTLSRLRAALEESGQPIRVNVLDWHAISEDFGEVIERGLGKRDEGKEARQGCHRWVGGD